MILTYPYLKFLIKKNIKMENKDEKLIESFVNYFGIGNIVDCVGTKRILSHIDDDALLDEVFNSNSMYDILDYIPEDEIAEYLGMENEYQNRSEDENLAIKNELADIIRVLKPRGYISKEEAKRLLCEYIDSLPTFNIH